MAKEPKAMVRWDEEFARQAEEAAAQEAYTGGGSFMSTRGGILQVNNAPVPNNQLGAVVVDSIIVNAMYEGEYDPDNKQSPICYAFGRDEKAMKPHPEAPQPQHADCASCPHNQFGSAKKGRGKACKNGRRVALISAGTYEGERFKPFTDAKHFATAERFYLNLAPTSIGGFGSFVKQLAGALKLPPHGIFTRVRLVPDPKTQFKVTFEPLSRAPVELAGTLIARHKAERAVIEFPFPKPEDRPAAKGKGKPAKKGAGY